MLTDLSIKAVSAVLSSVSTAAARMVAAYPLRQHRLETPVGLNEEESEDCDLRPEKVVKETLEDERRCENDEFWACKEEDLTKNDWERVREEEEAMFCQWGRQYLTEPFWFCRDTAGKVVELLVHSEDDERERESFYYFKVFVTILRQIGFLVHYFCS